MTRSTTKNDAGEHVKAEAAPRRGTAPRVIRLVPRHEVTSSAYRRLRDLIVAGRLAPGAPLVETELSERLGVSRTPVRAALQRLQQEGFVGRLAGRHDAARHRRAADGGRHARGVPDGGRPRSRRRPAWPPASTRIGATALADEMARLAGGPARGIGVAPARRRRARTTCTSRFHRTYATAARRPAAARRTRGAPAAGRTLRAGLRERDRVVAFDEAARDHAAIVDALRAGDADGVERAVAAATGAASAERYGQVVTILGERGNW